MDAAYTLVQDLLRNNTLTAFNNDQAMFEEQTMGSLEQCLNAVIVHMFPNKAYKLQKWYIQNMMYKSRHVSVSSTRLAVPPTKDWTPSETNAMGKTKRKDK
eukprot:7782598-Ditylum_brightwellii.AAC.1